MENPIFKLQMVLTPRASTASAISPVRKPVSMIYLSNNDPEKRRR